MNSLAIFIQGLTILIMVIYIKLFSQETQKKIDAIYKLLHEIIEREKSSEKR